MNAALRPPPVRREPRWTCRAAAIATVVMAGLVTVEFGRGSRNDNYVFALVAALFVGALVVAVRLWRRRSFESTTSAVALATITLIGQALVATVGSPVTPDHADAHWTLVAFGVVGCALAVLGLLAADAPSTGQDEGQDRPYAL